MKLPSWITLRYRRDAPAQASLTKCPTCATEMILVERTSMSGDDMRTYRCDRCQKEHIVDFGTAMWKLMSDANKSEE
jgi:transposase-like protein